MSGLVTFHQINSDKRQLQAAFVPLELCHDVRANAPESPVGMSKLRLDLGVLC